MQPYFHLFAKKRCKYCTRASKLLDSKKLAYVISYMDKAPEALKELQQGCNWETVPVVLQIHGAAAGASLIGGYTELEEYLDGSTTKKEGFGEGMDVVPADSL